MDDRIRRLEREARLGDPGAIKALSVAQRRGGGKLPGARGLRRQHMKLLGYQAMICVDEAMCPHLTDFSRGLGDSAFAKAYHGLLTRPEDRNVPVECVYYQAFRPAALSGNWEEWRCCHKHKTKKLAYACAARHAYAERVKQAYRG